MKVTIRTQPANTTIETELKLPSTGKLKQGLTQCREVGRIVTVASAEIHNDRLKIIALGVAGIIATWGMFVMGWCAMWRIYVDVPMLLVLSNIVTGIASSITTLLVGRTISQLNQQSDVRNQPQIDQAAT